jgi:hypothetical protein
MKVVVDGEVREEFAEAPDMFSVVASVSDTMRESRCGIVELRFNGEIVSPENVRDMMIGKEGQTDDVLEFKTAPVEKLVEAALSGLDDYLPELAKACRSLAEIFQSDSPENGFEMFRDLADAWMEIKSRESKAANILELDLDTLLIEGVSMSVLHEELNGFLEEAAQALDDNDCVLLGDLLEYELAPRAEMELEIVTLLRRQLGTGAE